MLKWFFVLILCLVIAMPAAAKDDEFSWVEDWFTDCQIRQAVNNKDWDSTNLDEVYDKLVNPLDSKKKNSDKDVSVWSHNGDGKPPNLSERVYCILNGDF